MPGHSILEECMLITKNKNRIFYKAGIFFCDTTCRQAHQDITEFWVISFFSLIENTGLGKPFHEIEPFIQWRKISSEDFSNTYFDLIHNYRPEDAFQESPSYKTSRTDLEKPVFSEGFKVLDTDLIKSAVAGTADDDYVSYFIIDEIVSEQHGW